MLRFSIRDVLWLTVVVALGVGWWMEHRAKEIDKELAVLRAILTTRDQLGLRP